MATVTISLGAKVIFERPDGTVEVYLFMGGIPLEWEVALVVRHTHVLDEPNTRIKVINP